ncbi:hypothetical protein UCRPC4_g00623 [Phaeomoniella chlamydospora]|uniref:Myb-like domain-containing protein n=1 Tax=Phaeomoniella chlamydospora TaxID=158046 RepID=A0A0G2F2B9_PHACM|nr:hypothetical protein UCRPC4_g00623 [Phaeomoniella chlamydospora]
MADGSSPPNKSGTPRKKRPESRVLVRWNDEIDLRLLLMIDSITKQKNVKLPWDDIAAALGPKFSAGAIIQHLSKLRQRFIIADREALEKDKTPEANVLPLERGRKQIGYHVPGQSTKRARLVKDEDSMLSSDDNSNSRKKKQKRNIAKALINTQSVSSKKGIKKEDDIDDYLPPSRNTRGVNKDYKHLTEENESSDEEPSKEVTIKGKKAESGKDQDSKATFSDDDSGLSDIQSPATGFSSDSSGRQGDMKRFPEKKRLSLIVKLPLRVQGHEVNNARKSEDLMPPPSAILKERSGAADNPLKYSYDEFPSNEHQLFGQFEQPMAMFSETEAVHGSMTYTGSNGMGHGLSISQAPSIAMIGPNHRHSISSISSQGYPSLKYGGTASFSSAYNTEPSTPQDDMIMTSNGNRLQDMTTFNETNQWLAELHDAAGVEENPDQDDTNFHTFFEDAIHSPEY